MLAGGAEAASAGRLRRDPQAIGAVDLQGRHDLGDGRSEIEAVSLAVAGSSRWIRPSEKAANQTRPARSDVIASTRTGRAAFSARKSGP